MKLSIARSMSLGGQPAPPIKQKLIGLTVNPVSTATFQKIGDAASVLSLVDDATALAAAGLSTIATNGQVYQLDNSGGIGAAYIRWVANDIIMGSDTWALSCYMRGTGTGLIDVNAGSWNGVSSFALAAAYDRKVSVGVTSQSTNLYRLGVNAGTVAYFIMMQAEIGSAATTYRLRLA